MVVVDISFSMLYLFLLTCVFVLQDKGASGLITNRKDSVQAVQLSQHAKYVMCKRISSSSAAEMIRDAYRCHYKHTSSLTADELNDRSYNQSVRRSLLIVTSDASRGANRLSGLSSILREINKTEDNSGRGDNINEQQQLSSKQNSSQEWESSDRVTFATRRIHSKNARDVSKSEVAAVAIGVRAALNYIPPQNRRQVLFLTDSTSVLDYYCENNDVTCSSNEEENHNHHISSAQLNDPHFKAMQYLINDTRENNANACSLSSNDDQTLVFMAKVKSNKMETDGFFDHDASDIISSLVKKISNKKIGKIFIRPQARTNNIHCDDQKARTANNLSTWKLTAPPLRLEDLQYLSASELRLKEKQVAVKKPQVVLKKKRGERLCRCKQRMMDEFGICGTNSYEKR